MIDVREGSTSLTPSGPDLFLDPHRTALIVVDVQERLVGAMDPDRAEACIENVVRLVKGARILDVPVAVTEQYPKGLGPTVEPIRAALATVPDAHTVEKLDFDACRCADFERLMGQLGRSSVVVTGMEAHICVWQTARGLRRAGHSVHVPMDATCSRATYNQRVAEGLLGRAGAVVTCTETVLFDLLGRAEGDAFKAISRLVR